MKKDLDCSYRVPWTIQMYHDALPDNIPTDAKAVVLDVSLGQSGPVDLVLRIKSAMTDTAWQETHLMRPCGGAWGNNVDMRVTLVLKSRYFYWSCEKYPKFKPIFRLIGWIK